MARQNPDSLMTYVVLKAPQSFPSGSDSKESACKGGDLGWEEPPEKEMATHSSILAWRIPQTSTNYSTLVDQTCLLMSSK